MQAIILAAGMGRRLGEYTRNNTKCMVEVNGQKLIDRLLLQLQKLNLSRIIIVVGYKGKELQAHVQASPFPSQGEEIDFVENPVYDKTNNIYSLSLVKEQLAQDDTLLIESDLILSDRLLPMLVEAPEQNVALVAKYESWMDGTMVSIDDDRNIVNFITKDAFNYNDTDKYYKTVNVYKFSREFAQQKYVPFLDAYTKAVGNNEYYENVLRKYYGRYGGFWRFPQMLDYCYLVNPYFPSRRMKDEMRANFDTLLTEYPSGMKVNTLIASKCFGVSEQYLVPGNGAAELIKGLSQEGEYLIGFVRPTFEEYPNRVDKERHVTFVPQNEDYRYTADDLMAFFADKGIGQLMLINPDNPSGNFIPKDDVLRLASWCEQRSIRLVVDESFVDFSRDYATNSLLSDQTLETYPHMVVMKSISKSYGVPGLRLGIMASADKELIARMKREVSIWNLNSFAEFFMQIFNKYEKDYQKACAKFVQERDRFEQDLRSVPFFHVMSSEANYFLCEVLPPYTASEIVIRMLKQHNILTRDCSGKPGLNPHKQYMRIAVRSTEDNMRLVEALKIKD